MRKHPLRGIQNVFPDVPTFRAEPSWRFASLGSKVLPIASHAWVKALERFPQGGWDVCGFCGGVIVAGAICICMVFKLHCVVVVVAVVKPDFSHQQFHLPPSYPTKLEQGTMNQSTTNQLCYPEGIQTLLSWTTVEPMEPERVPKTPPQTSGFGVEKKRILKDQMAEKYSVPHQIHSS